MNYDHCKTDNQELMKAWNMFMETGIVPTEFLRPDAYTSWIRCSHQVIDEMPLSIGQQVNNQENEGSLINNARQVMNNMNDILANLLGSNYALILTDSRGKVLLDVAYKDNEIIPWEPNHSSEHYTVLKATNIACREKQVVEVYGYEQLYQRADNLHTVGHPIFNLDKSIAGGLGILIRSTNTPPTVPIVKIGSQIIQSAIVLEQIAKNNIGILLEDNQEAVIVINEHGIIMNANQIFSDLLNIPADQLIGQQFGDYIKGNINYGTLYSICDGFGMISSVSIRGLKNRYSAMMKKSIIGNYGNNHLVMLAFKSIRSKNIEVSSKTPVIDDQFHMFDKLVGNSPLIIGVKKIAQKAARSLSNVLIEGESGTGKELIAQSIHKISRPQGPFIAINCGAITKELLQSELFGYEEGAFTGAKKGGQPGKFELADGGTVFLDEIGEMPLDMQVSLLRCLQEKTVTRVGGVRSQKVDVRIIAATNRCLYDEMHKGNFREDLYYRLNVINITMPSLRERIQDIPALTRHILKALCKDLEITEQIKISAEAMDCLCRYDWPGNVRELQNVLESALIYMENNILSPECLPQQIADSLPKAYADINGSLKEYERVAIMEAIIRNKGNISKSAMELGIARSTLYQKMDKLCIAY